MIKKELVIKRFKKFVKELFISFYLFFTQSIILLLFLIFLNQYFYFQLLIFIDKDKYFEFVINKNPASIAKLRKHVMISFEVPYHLNESTRKGKKVNQRKKVKRSEIF